MPLSGSANFTGSDLLRFCFCYASGSAISYYCSDFAQFFWYRFPVSLDTAGQEADTWDCFVLQITLSLCKAQGQSRVWQERFSQEAVTWQSRLWKIVSKLYCNSLLVKLFYVLSFQVSCHLYCCWYQTILHSFLVKTIII